MVFDRRFLSACHLRCLPKMQKRTFLTMILAQHCREPQYTVQRIIETAGDDEALLFEALCVNEKIQKVLSSYEDIKKTLEVKPELEPAMIPVAVEPDDSPHVVKENALMKASKLVNWGPWKEHDDMTDDLDEMIFGKKAGGTSKGA